MIYNNLHRLQNRLLSHVITLPPNEVVQVLKAIAGTPTGGAMACRFLQAKWYELQSKMGAGSINFARVISAITQYGATKFDYDEVCTVSVFAWLSLVNINLYFFHYPVKIIGPSVRRWSWHAYPKHDIEKRCCQC